MMGNYRSLQNVVGFDGQSQNFYGGYPTTIMASFPLPNNQSQFLAVGGSSWTVLAADATTRVDKYAKCAEHSILIMTGTFSDIASEGDTGTIAFNDQVAYAEARLAAGWQTIINTTLLKATPITGDEEAARQLNNTLVLAEAGPSGAWQAVADLAAITDGQDPTNTTFFVDGVHWQTALASQGAALVVAAMTPFML